MIILCQKRVAGLKGHFFEILTPIRCLVQCSVQTPPTQQVQIDRLRTMFFCSMRERRSGISDQRLAELEALLTKAKAGRSRTRTEAFNQSVQYGYGVINPDDM